MLLIATFLIAQMMSPSPLPKKKEETKNIVIRSLPSCPKKQDYIQLQKNTLVLTDSAIIRIDRAMTDINKNKDQLDKNQLVVFSHKITNSIKKDDFILFQKDIHSNSGYGIKVDLVEKKPDGIYLTYHLNSPVLQVHTPVLDQTKKIVYDQTPWEEQKTTATVIVDSNTKKTMINTNLPSIQKAEKNVVLCK